MQFWNKDNKQFEVYVISEDSFYTIDGKPVQYQSTGIPENSAVKRLNGFVDQDKIKASPLKEPGLQQ